MKTVKTVSTKPVPAAYTSAVTAAEALFEIASRRRVVAKVREGAYKVCSRSKARRLGYEIVATNYS
jgi:hypothetical protein